MLIKPLDEELNESFESEVSNEGDEHRRSSRESDVHREIVRVLVSCLDYRTQSDNLVLWTYLTESLKYLYFKTPKAITFTRQLFEHRIGWWAKQNFRNEAQCSDEVIVKKAIVCAILHGCDEQMFKVMSQNIEERKISSRSSYFVNLAKELDSVVMRLNSPLLEQTLTRPVKFDKIELREEWVKIRKIKSELETPRKPQRNPRKSKKKK